MYSYDMSDAKPYVMATVLAVVVSTSALTFLYLQGGDSIGASKLLYVLAILSSITAFVAGFAGISGAPSAREAITLRLGEAFGLVTGFFLIAIAVVDNLLFAKTL